MTEQAGNQYDEDEVSLLDILVTLAESWKLLVFGPLIAALLAGALSFLLPNKFESVAIVRLADEDVALLHAAPVLDPLVEKFGLLAKADGNWEDARQDLKKQVFFAVDKKTKLATVTANAETPHLAQALGDAAVAALMIELKVKGQEKALLQKIIAINERSIEISEEAIQSIQVGFKRGSHNDQAQESAVKSLATITSDIAKRKQENEEIRLKLEGRDVEIFVQKSNLPQRKASPKRRMLMLVVLLASIFALVLFVLIRKAWYNAEQNAVSASKTARIKQLLGLRTKR